MSIEDERKQTDRGRIVKPNVLSKLRWTIGFRTNLVSPAYGPDGSRCIGGMISIQALVRNVRTLLQMRREMTNGQHHEEDTDAGARGGAARSRGSLCNGGGAKGRRYPADKRCQPSGMNGVASAKPYGIAKCMVWEAYQQVKTNRGAAGIDDETIDDFEQNLSRILYKLWNRMSSGSYYPPPVKQVEIPKASGGTRKLGVPT